MDKICVDVIVMRLYTSVTCIVYIYVDLATALTELVIASIVSLAEVSSTTNPICIMVQNTSVVTRLTSIASVLSTTIT